MTVEKRIEKMLKEQSKEYALSIEKTKEALIKSWGLGGDRGYGIFTSDDVVLEHIERIDELNVYDNDLDAAKQAEKDGIKLIPLNENPNEYPYNCYQFLDTPRNRKLLKKYSN